MLHGEFQVPLNPSVLTKILEPRLEKTGLQGFKSGQTQIHLYSYRRWLEAWNFRCRKKRNLTIQVAKNKAAGKLLHS